MIFPDRGERSYLEIDKGHSVKNSTCCDVKYRVYAVDLHYSFAHTANQQSISYIRSSPRRRSSMFSQDSRRSSISDGSNSCSTYTYRASRRISSLFAYYDVLVQETSGADESSHTASKDSSALGKEHSPTNKAAVANNNNSRRQSFSAIEFFASLGLEEEEINDDSSTTSSEGKKSLDDAEH